MDLIVAQDFGKNQIVLMFSYVTEKGHTCFELRSDQNKKCFQSTFDDEGLKEFIKFLQEGLVPSMVTELEYDSERGISVPVDKNPSRE